MLAAISNLFGFNQSAPMLPAIKEMWEKEEALTLPQRRARYKCKDKYVTPKDIILWESYEAKFADKKFDLKAPTSSKAAANKFFSNKFGVQAPNLYKWKEDPVLNSKVALWRGNVIQLEFDAVLNAANNSMLGGGGIDGAIHSAAGPMLYDECELHNGCPTGMAKITRGYRLPAKYVIATVGPVGEDAELLYNAYYNSLELAKKNKIRTFALCGVSTGVYGYPLYAATHIAMATVRSWLEKNSKHVDMILFITFLEREVVCHDTLMSLYFPRSSVILRRSFQPQQPQDEEEEEETEEGKEKNEEKGETKEEEKQAEVKEAKKDEEMKDVQEEVTKQELKKEEVKQKEEEKEEEKKVEKKVEEKIEEEKKAEEKKEENEEKATEEKTTQEAVKKEEVKEPIENKQEKKEGEGKESDVDELSAALSKTNIA